MSPWTDTPRRPAIVKRSELWMRSPIGKRAHNGKNSNKLPTKSKQESRFPTFQPPTLEICGFSEYFYQPPECVSVRWHCMTLHDTAHVATAGCVRPVASHPNRLSLFHFYVHPSRFHNRARKFCRSVSCPIIIQYHRTLPQLSFNL